MINYTPKVNGKPVAFNLNDNDIQAQERLSYLASSTPNQIRYNSPYNFNKEEEYVNDMTRYLLSSYGETGSQTQVDRVYGHGVDTAMSLVLNKPIEEIIANRDAYKMLFTGGEKLDDRSFVEAFSKSWQSEENSRYIARLQNKFDKSKDEDEKADLLKQIEIAELQQIKMQDYAERGWLQHNVIQSAPILRQGLRTVAISYASGLALSGLVSLAQGAGFAESAMKNFVWANNLLRDGGKLSTLATAGGVKGLVGKTAVKAIAGVANPMAMGSTLGMIYDGYRNVYLTERGSLSREIYNITDENGNRIDDDTRNLMSTLGGLLITGAEYATPEPFIKRGFGGAHFQQIAGATFKAKTLDYFKNSLIGAHGESIEEAIQTIIGEVAKDLAKNFSKTGDFEVDTEGMLERYFTEAVASYAQSFFPSLLAGLQGNIVGAGTNTIASYAKAIAKGEKFSFSDARSSAIEGFQRSAELLPEDGQILETIRQNQDMTSAFTVKKNAVATYGEKLTNEQKQALNEKYKDKKAPPVKVSYDKDTDTLVPVDDENNNLAKWLLRTKGQEGLNIALVKKGESRFSTGSIDGEAYNHNGVLNEEDNTITFETQADLEDFVKNISSETSKKNDDGSITVDVLDEDGNKVSYTLSVGDNAGVQPLNNNVQSSADKNNENVASQATNLDTFAGTKMVSDENGNTVEVFDETAIRNQIKNAMPDWSDEDIGKLSKFITTLPSSVQNDMINKIRKSGATFQDLFLSEGLFEKMYENDPDMKLAGEKGNAFTLLHNAQIVLKNGKSTPHDVIHELHHVLFNMYPEYRRREARAIKNDMGDKKRRAQFRRFYRSNKEILDDNGTTNKKTGAVEGAVHSEKDFMDLLAGINEKSVEEEFKGKGSHKYEELLSRMASVIMFDPSNNAMQDLPSSTRNVLSAVVNKLKQIYKNIVGKDFAPSNYEKAVYSAYNPKLMKKSEANNNRVAYSGENEYNGRSGYEEGHYDSDRTEDYGRLSGSSERPVRFFNGKSFVRDFSADGVSGKQGRFEGSEVLRGTGEYVGNLANHAKFINLLLSKNGKNGADVLSFVKMDKNQSNAELFSDKLATARLAKHGYMVDGKEANELLNPENNMDFYISDDGSAGFAIERNHNGHEGVNNIVAVFNYAFDGIKGKRGIYSIMMNAIEQGGNVLDCFADGLHNMYAEFGFVPFANNEFLEIYADDNWRHDYIDRGVRLPDVTAMYLAYANINDVANHLDEILNSDPFASINYMDDYDDMMEKRDLHVESMNSRQIAYSGEIQGSDYTKEEAIEMVQADIQNIIDENQLPVEIVGVDLHGSRLRGQAREDSDLDVVVEYRGDFNEDDLFNIINENAISIDGIQVDVNPIRAEETGTLEDYMKRSNLYDQEMIAGDIRYSSEMSDENVVELAKTFNPISATEGNMISVVDETNGDQKKFVDRISGNNAFIMIGDESVKNIEYNILNNKDFSDALKRNPKRIDEGNRLLSRNSTLAENGKAWKQNRQAMLEYLSKKLKESFEKKEISLEDAVKNQIEIYEDEITRPTDKVYNLISSIPEFGLEGKREGESSYEWINRVLRPYFAGNLRYLMKRAPLKKAIKSLVWYQRARIIADYMSENFNIPAEQASAIIAVTSPNCPWERNVSQAIGIATYWDSLSEEERNLSSAVLADRCKEWFRGKNAKSYTVDNLTGLKEVEGYTWSTTGAFLRKSFDILKGKEGAINAVSQAVKVRSFYNNILNPASVQEVLTLDTHMVRSAFGVPFSTAETIGKSVRKFAYDSVLDGKSYETYIINAEMQEAIREIASEYHIQPHMAQAIIWNQAQEFFGEENMSRQIYDKDTDTYHNASVISDNKYSVNLIREGNARNDYIGQEGRVLRILEDSFDAGRKRDGSDLSTDTFLELYSDVEGSFGRLLDRGFGEDIRGQIDNYGKLEAYTKSALEGFRIGEEVRKRNLDGDVGIRYSGENAEENEDYNGLYEYDDSFDEDLDKMAEKTAKQETEKLQKEARRAQPKDSAMNPEYDERNENVNIFDVNNPNSLINRTILTWDDLTSDDILQILKANFYIPSDVLQKFGSLAEVKAEMQDRNQMYILASKDARIPRLAMQAQSAEDFFKQVKKLFGYNEKAGSNIEKTHGAENDAKQWEPLYKKYYNYVHTASPAEYSSYFLAKYASSKTSLEDLLELKSLLGIRRLKTGVKNGVAQYKVVSEKSKLYRLLSRLNANATSTQVNNITKEIRNVLASGDTTFIREYARAMINMGRETALDNGKGEDFYSPFLSSWLVMSMGQFDDSFLTMVKATTDNSEMSKATKDGEDIDKNMNALKNDGSVAVILEALQSALGAEFKSHEEDINQYLRDIYKWERDLEYQKQSKEYWKEEYEKAKRQLEKEKQLKGALFGKIYDLVEANERKQYRNEVRLFKLKESAKAQTIRMKKQLAYANMFMKLQEKSYEQQLKTQAQIAEQNKRFELALQEKVLKAQSKEAIKAEQKKAKEQKRYSDIELKNAKQFDKKQKDFELKMQKKFMNLQLQAKLSQLRKQKNKERDEFVNRMRFKKDFEIKRIKFEAELNKKYEKLQKEAELFRQKQKFEDKLADAEFRKKYQKFLYEEKLKAMKKQKFYTEMIYKDSEKRIRAFYQEKIAKMNEYRALRNALSYSNQRHDVMLIDPVVSYLYKFLHNREKMFGKIDENEIRKEAQKRGETLDADDIEVVTYDTWTDIDDDANPTFSQMFDYRAKYNPNMKRVDLSNMPALLERYIPKELADKIKSGKIQAGELTSKDFNALRKALSLAKHIASMSQSTKKDQKMSRRRQSAQEVYLDQFKEFDVSKMDQDTKDKLRAKINSSTSYLELFSKEELDEMESLGIDPRSRISDQKLEDFVRKNPQAVSSVLYDKTHSDFRLKLDSVMTMFEKAQRAFEFMDGEKEGAIYRNLFKPMYEAYEKKLKAINEREAEAKLVLEKWLGISDADLEDDDVLSGKKNFMTTDEMIRANKKFLSETKMFKNNTVNDGNATIELDGWQQIGVYIYSKNIYGFIKLISSSGNNLALEEVARINPEFTRDFIELALEDRVNNKDILSGNKAKRINENHLLSDPDDMKLVRDVLSHVSTEDLMNVLYMLESGEIAESSLSKRFRMLGDNLIELMSKHTAELVRAGYDEYNILPVLQQNYFPLVRLSQDLKENDRRNKKGRVNYGALLRRNMIDTYALNLNPLTNFYSAIENQESIIHMSSAVNDAQWLMDSKCGNLGGMIEHKFGKAWADYTQEWVDMMARGNDGELKNFERDVNKFIANIASSRIGLNVMTSFKQLVSLVPAMTVGEIGPMETVQALGKIESQSDVGVTYKELMRQEAPSIFYSAFNVEAEKARHYDQTIGVGDLMGNVREKTMWLTETVDGKVKQAIWVAKYDKERKNGATVQDAIFRATQLVQTTQSITDRPSLSQLQRNQNPLMRVAFMFTNDLFQTWNVICGDAVNAWKQGNKRQAFTEAFGVMLNGAILAFLAGGWLGDKDDDDPWWEDFLHNWVGEMSAYVPIAGPWLQDVATGYSSPFYRGAEEVNDFKNMVYNQFRYWASDGAKGRDYEGGDYMDKAFNVFTEGAMTLGGLPATQAERFYKVFFPEGFAKGMTKSPSSMAYFFGSSYGRALYKED